MVSNKKYSLDFAAYNATVFSCQRGDPHDQNVYMSHCWACRAMIDSRVNKIQDRHGYYLCKRCGHGARQGAGEPGDTCPVCGRPEMEKNPTHQRLFHCNNCDHTIVVPNIRK